MNDEQIIMMLRNNGMRITKQRKIVAKVIAENNGVSCKTICCIVKNVLGISIKSLNAN